MVYNGCILHIEPKVIVIRSRREIPAIIKIGLLPLQCCEYDKHGVHAIEYVADLEIATILVEGHSLNPESLKSLK